MYLRYAPNEKALGSAVQSTAWWLRHEGEERLHWTKVHLGNGFAARLATDSEVVRADLIQRGVYPPLLGGEEDLDTYLHIVPFVERVEKWQQVGWAEWGIALPADPV